MTIKRSLIVHTEYSKGWGGQEIRIIEEMREMSRLGIEVALVAPVDSRVYQQANAEGMLVYPITFQSKFDIVSWIRLFKLFMKISPAIVNTHSSEDSWMAGAVARLTGVPLVIRTRHVSTPIGSTFSYRAFPHLILTTSKAIRSDLMSKGLNGQHITPVPTGIDLKRFQFAESNRDKIRNELGLRQGEILVGNVCVLRSWKGLDFFLETAAVMPENYKFIIVGDGPQMEHLQQKAGDLGIDVNRIIFVGHRQNVERYFSALDIFFFTSYASEGVPQALLQAVANGLPILACKNPSVEETLQGVKPTEFATYGNTDEAKNLLCLIADDKINKANSARFDNDAIVAKHSLKEMTHALLELYRRYSVNLCK